MNALFKFYVSTVLMTAGAVLLLVFDWRFAIGMFLYTWGANLAADLKPPPHVPSDSPPSVSEQR